MNEKYCHQCRSYKKLTEFYKSASTNDGLQCRCKVCSNVNNKKFRDKNPTYYWGTEDSYFMKHYKEEMDYLRRWGKADKNCLIYQLEVDGRIYIGSTKRTKKQICNSLKQDYNRMQKDPSIWRTPIQAAFDHLSKDELYNLVDSMTILMDFDGNRRQMRDEMVKIITQLKMDGKDIINKRIN
jgi:hypothetical protein